MINLQLIENNYQLQIKFNKKLQVEKIILKKGNQDFQQRFNKKRFLENNNKQRDYYQLNKNSG